MSLERASSKRSVQPRQPDLSTPVAPGAARSESSPPPGAPAPSKAPDAEPGHRLPRLWLMKENALRLADSHRANCEGEDCNVSLLLLGDLVTEAEIELTDEEWARFV